MNQRAIDHTLQLLGGMSESPPLIASHIACRLNGGADYNLSDDVIREIGKRSGVIGVIVCEHWANDGLPKAKTFADSVKVIGEHIERVRTVTGTDDHVAIGSDLDGYIKPALPGLEHEGRMKALNEALADRYGEALAEKFCSGNVLDLLGRYWRGGP
jgi:microsomal dipeptidase-like Zn-dependent dipeptidase